MSRLLRYARGLFLLCAPIVLAGCQHPLAPSQAGQHPDRVNYALVNATPVTFFDDAIQFPAPAITEEPYFLVETDLPESPQPKDATPVAGVQKQSDCLTGQLADSLMNVFKTFTGR